MSASCKVDENEDNIVKWERDIEAIDSAKFPNHKLPEGPNGESIRDELIEGDLAVVVGVGLGDA